MSGLPRRLRRRLSRRWRSVSFRSGLAAAVVVGTVTALALVALLSLGFLLFVVTDGLTQTNIIDRAEDQLLLGVAPDELRLPLPDAGNVPGPQGLGSHTFWAVLEGDTIVHSAGEVELSVIDAPYNNEAFGVEISVEGAPAETDFGLKSLSDGGWFFAEREVVVADGTRYRVVSAVNGTFTLGSFLRDSLVGLVPVVLIVMTVAGVITSFFTRRALRRVERIRAEVEQITQQSLNRRVPTADAADGIDKLGHTMNDMLERLEASSAQQNQFLADASHELRSPVAGLLAQLEVAAAYPDKVDAATLVPKLRDQAGRLQLLVEDLLFLGRDDVEGQQQVGSPATVDVDALLAAEQVHQRLIHPEVPIEVISTCGAHVSAASRDLERAVRNLVDNAVRHCEQQVTLWTSVADSAVTIHVADDGPGVAAEDAARIFDRFVRLDEARSRDAGGAGLGLAIAKEIATRSGGSLILLADDSPGATFQLTLPLARPTDR